MTQRGWLVVVGRFGRGGRKYWMAEEVVRVVTETVAAPGVDEHLEVSDVAT